MIEKVLENSKYFWKYRGAKAEAEVLKKENIKLKEKIKEILYKETMLKPAENERLRELNKRLRIQNKELKSKLKEEVK